MMMGNSFVDVVADADAAVVVAAVAVVVVP